MSEANGVDLSALGGFDFKPEWAKGSGKVTVGSFRQERAEKGEERSFGGAERKPFRQQNQEKGKCFDKPFVKRGERKTPRFERVKPLAADIKVLPDPKALGTIFRKLQQDFHAYKLKELAYFFLDNPASVLLKVTPKAESGESFIQCKACSFASTNEEDVIEHAVNAHLSDYFDSKEVEVEPPKGNFNCVAKCGLSGVLLGPPNIHEFGSVVREMIRTRYPQMTEQEYRSHIEMVRDSESIEAWRATATKKVFFFAKGQADQEGAKRFTRDEAEAEFRMSLLPSLLSKPKNLMITAAAAVASPSQPLKLAAQAALEAERRAPYGMCFALRGAFHHRKMNFFRANDSRGPEFVIGMELKPFDAEHAIAELSSTWKFISENPCCDKSEFPQIPDFEKHVQWLVSTGHVVAFTNGVYSAVEKFPKYGPQWKKRKKQLKEATAEASAAEEAPKVEAPAVEAPAAETPAAEAPATEA